jgi:hypothetical protein
MHLHRTHFSRGSKTYTTADLVEPKQNPETMESSVPLRILYSTVSRQSCN